MPLYNPWPKEKIDKLTDWFLAGCPFGDKPSNSIPPPSFNKPSRLRKSLTQLTESVEGGF